MSKEIEVLENLGVFSSRGLLQLDENILQLYIKIRGKKLTKIKNLNLESYYGEVYKVKNNTIYYQETYEPLNDISIKVSEDKWEEYGIIDFIGKKEDYEPKVKTIPMKEWKNTERKLKAFEIIKRTGLNIDWFVSSFIKQDADYNVFLMLLEEMGNEGHLAEQIMMSEEEFDLLKEVLGK